MRPPFDMNRDYYDLSHSGPADRPFPVMVRRTRDISKQAHATAGQMVAIRAVVERAERMTLEEVRDYQARQAHWRPGFEPPSITWQDSTVHLPRH